MIDFTPYSKRIKWISALLLIIPLTIFITATSVVYFMQDQLVQELLLTANKDFNGQLEIKGSHIAPFANFPNTSIDLEEVTIYEGKQKNLQKRIAHFDDIYIGFNLWKILQGKVEIRSIQLDNGKLKLLQYRDGSLNITNALSSKEPAKKTKETLNLDLKSIELNKVDVSKYNLASGVHIDAYISEANSSLKVKNNHTFITLNSRFVLSLNLDGDSTFIKRKHFSLVTEFDLNEKTKILNVAPTEVQIEKATFGLNGSVKLNNDIDLDLRLYGNKPNFDLFLALAPQELQTTLEEFDNKGKVFFKARVKGPSANGKSPAISARFGCKEGFFNNLTSGKKLDKIGFRGTFTNGKKHDFSTMCFELENFTAKPEAGNFKGKLKVQNFSSPDIDMNLNSDFDLEFLSKFLNNRELSGLTGRVVLNMNFHDIIDFNAPEKSIERLNESYFTELLINDLSFNSPSLPVPLQNLDLKATIKGHKAKLEKLDIRAGNTDIHINGDISDLPAIIHHTNDLVHCRLNISSKLLDIKELTCKNKGSIIDEEIEDLSLNLVFNSNARAFTESPNLPVGEFFIDNLYAKFKHYPHTLHDFRADILIDDQNFKVIDFSGLIDQSDFHFSGSLVNYGIWFKEQLEGDTKIEFDLASKHFHLDDVFTYKGEKFVPEDYRNEEVKGLKLHGKTTLHFDKGLQATNVQISNFQGKFKLHKLRFEDFNGDILYANDLLQLKNLNGKMGQSTFSANLKYHFKDNTAPHYLRIKAAHLDIDELLNYNISSSASSPTTTKVDHDAVFSLYDLAFPNMDFEFDVQHLNYHHHQMDHFKAVIRMKKNHNIHIDHMNFDAAGGHFDMRATLSGADKKHIYLEPNISVRNVDLDRFMVKFENFGQDYLVSENLHGKFTGKLTGKIHLHADLTPKIDDSELSISMTVLNGRLENYAPIQALATYFQDKNVNKVVFDTLENTLRIKKGIMSIPLMTINSTLGFMELTGEQRLDEKMTMNYIIGVPWKMIGEVAGQKLFKRAKSANVDSDAIQYREKNSRFVYIKLSGDIDHYSFDLTKKPR
jgi:uncharacterized protein involved in outer membrane biogenesis